MLLKLVALNCGHIQTKYTVIISPRHLPKPLGSIENVEDFVDISVVTLRLLLLLLGTAGESVLRLLAEDDAAFAILSDVHVSVMRVVFSEVTLSRGWRWQRR